jgi:hypothetical protein
MKTYLGWKGKNTFYHYDSSTILSSLPLQTKLTRNLSSTCRRLDHHRPPRRNYIAITAIVSQLSDALVNPTVVAPTAVGLILAAIGALRFYTYSQIELITASMLSRHVKPGGARVLQVGGSTRDLYYYPKGTTSVTILLQKEGESSGFWEQAGLQAQVPVDIVRKSEGIREGSYDSVVAFNQLDSKKMISNTPLITKLKESLKPGGTFIFIQKLSDGVEESTIDKLVDSPSWDFCQWDSFLGGIDGHVAGVGIKSMTGGKDESVDKGAFEQVMKMKKKKRRN